MDTSFEDSHNVKIPPLTAQETQKKKRVPKKKAEAKPSKVEVVEIPEVIPDTNVEAEADLINYTYKLEYELAATKKKIKQERKKFRQLLHSFAKHMDTMGITANLVDEYIQSLNPQTHESVSDSDFEKLFTTHKYQVIDDTGHLHNGNTLPKATSNRKSATKSQPNLIKGTSVEKSTFTNESTAAGSPPEQISYQPPTEKKPAKPKKEKAPKPEGETETKKRKPKKPKEVIEENDNDDVIEIPQIPPLDLKPKKDHKGEDKNMMTQQQPQHQQYQQMQSNARMGNPLDMLMQNPNMLDDALKSLMQQVNIDPNQLLQMNPYLMMNAGNQHQPQENDMGAYEKMLQEMMKGGNGNQLLAPDKETQDLLNYYQRSFK